MKNLVEIKPPAACIDPTPETTLLEIGAIRHELSKLLGVHVNVPTPKALPETFRNRVLS